LKSDASITAKSIFPSSYVGKTVHVFHWPAVAQIGSCATIEIGPVEDAADLARGPGKIGRSASNRKIVAQARSRRARASV
jgi:hypothetical protein